MSNVLKIRCSTCEEVKDEEELRQLSPSAKVVKKVTK